MSDFDDFSRTYGRPMPGTAAFDPMSGQNLDGDLQAFASELGVGVFAHGFISVLSERERACRPNPWLSDVPEGAEHIATTAFGGLVAASGGRAVMIDILLGNVMFTELSIKEALLRLAEPETQEELLHCPLFERWRKITGSSLDPSQILVPTPLPVLGGQLAIDTVRPVDASVAMSLTHQSYDGRHGERVRIF
jgi:hypothetical protein